MGVQWEAGVERGCKVRKWMQSRVGGVQRGCRVGGCSVECRVGWGAEWGGGDGYIIGGAVFSFQ